MKTIMLQCFVWVVRVAIKASYGFTNITFPLAVAPYILLCIEPQIETLTLQACTRNDVMDNSAG